MTHSELTGVAKRWLMRPESARGPGCKVAFVEVGAVGDSEIADAWGYRWGWEAASVLVEVKVSRSDFLRDRRKPHRQQEGKGLGQYRYFMCPEGVIHIKDLPDRWGLLWVNKRGHVKLMAGHVCCHVAGGCGSTRELAFFWNHVCDMDTERALLAYMVARVGDPDALLQEQRGYRRAHQQLQERLDELEKARRDDNITIFRLRTLLEKNGLEVPEPLSRRISRGRSLL